ncbi:DNA repair protein RecN [Aerococcaceae bacterium DSM 111021]|nr:DNA repair protein RecN [Aerococcaceae bacterium DSM 111021]
MLQSLTIENFAIIEEVNIDFTEGMTVLSGETGAGKSIIIDALGILCGGRGSSEYIRHGDDKLLIEGLFTFDNLPDGLESSLLNFGLNIDIMMDGLIIRREINKSGKNTIRINGQLANVTLLKDIGNYLVDIHGQNEHQELLDRTKHLSLLDNYGNKRINEALSEYQEAYYSYNKLRKEWLEAQQSDSNDRQRVNFLEFQIEEIEAAELVIGEDEELETISKKLQHAQQINQNMSMMTNILSESDQSIITQLDQVLVLLDEIKDYQPEIAAIQEGMTTTRFDIEEYAHQLASLDYELDNENQTIDQVENRLGELSRLKRKYGMELAEILDYYNEISEEVYQILHRESYLEELEEQLTEAYSSVLEKANQLNDKRKVIAEDLVLAIELELKDLYMENSRFTVRFTEPVVDTELKLMNVKELVRFTPNGFNLIEFYVATNVGEGQKPLVQVASGGELSRFMLALKTVFSRETSPKVMVFDEIDTGVSGRVGQAIAEKIREVSNSHQVFCITHLPQVAAISNKQLYIFKQVEDQKTSTNVKQLSSNERIEAIALMLSGREITPTSLQMADELLKEYHIIK